MKIVLSRKGFDAVNGGRPSPILPDGTLVPLPIPDLSETSGITYGDINSAHHESIGNVVEDLTKQRVRRGHFAHLDPDLRRSAYPRLRGWQPLFGQAGGDQTHLERQGVTLGDLFLFFGWFREVEIINERYRYVRNAPNLHVIYGWLQIGRILRVPTAHVPRWAEYHHHFHPPSSSGNWIDNTVYVSTPRLILNGRNHDTHGGGVFARYNEQLRLTCPNQRNRTLWQLPNWFYPRDGRSPLSRHGNRNRWTLEGDHTILDSVDLGQEFVFDADEYPEAIPWVHQLMTLAPAEDGKVMKAPERDHKTVLTADAEMVDASHKLVVTPGEKQNGDASKQDLQQALRQSRDSEARLRKIIDTIPALAWCNLSDGSNDFVNQRWSDYTGLSQEEVKQVGCKVAIHPEDLPRWLDQWRALLASGAGGEIEARLRRHDGDYRWFLIRVQPLQEESGEILRWYGTNTDIEDRKRAEEKLREDEREIRRITDAIPQTIMVQNPSGVPIYANQAVLDYTGLTIDDVISSDFRARIFHSEDLERLHDEREAALVRGLPFEFEQRALRKDGRYRWFLIQYNPLRDEHGAIMRWYATGTDIDDRKRNEERTQNENLVLREEIERSSMFEEIVGSSEGLRQVLAQVSKVAPTDSTVLILGETGTGKELIARAIHNLSKRSTRAFIGVNCAAIQPALVTSELFGHEKGSFTGAFQRRLGRFESADGGTIFLDEVGELPPETQVALLRVLQEREFERVGGSQTVSVDVRVLAATNSDLSAAVAEGTFRQDLFYRLNVFPIRIPALRERVDDIPLLVEYLIDRYAQAAGKKIKNINKGTLDLFQHYDWPGNVRELQNVIERAVILSDGDTFSVDETWLTPVTPKTAASSVPLVANLIDHEKEMIEAALREAEGLVSGPTGAATKLGIPRQTLESKIRKLGINRHRFKTS